MEFKPNWAFSTQLFCRNYLEASPVYKYNASKKCYDKEAWYQTSLRVASWFLLAPPLIIGITLAISHRLASSAIQERKIYWSGKNANGEDRIQQPPRKPEIESLIREYLIHALANSDVPKMPFERIFLHPCGYSRSVLSFGSDTYFKDIEAPNPDQKTLHIFHQFLNVEKVKKNMKCLLQDYNSMRSIEGILRERVALSYHNAHATEYKKTENQMAHGMISPKVDALSRWPFGSVPASLKILLTTGKTEVTGKTKGTKEVNLDYKKAFENEYDMNLMNLA